MFQHLRPVPRNHISSVCEESQAAWEDTVGIDHFYGRHNTSNCRVLTETSASISSASPQPSGFYRIGINHGQYSQVTLTCGYPQRSRCTSRQNDPDEIINVVTAFYKKEKYTVSIFNNVLCMRDVHRNPEGLLKKGCCKRQSLNQLQKKKKSANCFKIQRLRNFLVTTLSSFTVLCPELTPPSVM